MTARWYDAMGFSVAYGPTQTTGDPPPAESLGLIPSAYFGYSYFGTNAGAIDSAKLNEVGRCLPPSTLAVPDMEIWIGALATVDGGGNPIPKALMHLTDQPVIGRTE